MKGTNPAAPEDMIGALDLGGASTQISFYPGPSYQLTGEKGKDMARLMLFGKSYNIYSHSFLCYGKSRAQQRIWAFLAKDVTQNATLQNPCLLQGYRTSLNATELFNDPCIFGDFATTTFGLSFSKPRQA
ncbi:unnamed protein product [Protopolystoma xenopodis]|uniref:Uncharacterized protein n=1 Tax=Protopolystoma xenopodis TaxID=117903 RepID=A0A448XDA4_9PLAT|nr:unnamed protein product [Protopolystoma xenopodis]